MHISRIQILNFRNFAQLDVFTEKNLVVVGQNRTGKSNLIHALRLVLDASLPDAARQLKLSDFWDGCDLATSPEIQIHVDFTDFATEPNLVALLTDYRLAADHTTARLSYVYRKKPDVAGAPTSEADFEFTIYGGADETRSLRSDVRRRISLDLLHALRDAEGDLSTWRSSPLRPLLEDAIAKVPKTDIDAIAAEIQAATAKLGALAPIGALEASLRADIRNLAGSSQDLRAKLAFGSTDALRLFRAIALYIDDGKRGITEASLGSANVALLALKLAEFAWRRVKNERNYTILIVEEPEAHLHPHLQRKVFQNLLAAPAEEPRALFVTTHSPNIASVAALKSILLLRATAAGTKGYSLSGLNLAPADLEDLQRYLDVTRAELLFASGVIFVEGDAEAALLPVFAKNDGVDLDELGISVCSVGGVNFSPYVKLATALGMPFAVITDWDPMPVPKQPLGRKRALDLIDDIRATKGGTPLAATIRARLAANDAELKEKVATVGIFLNASTLEVDIGQTAALSSALLSILDAEKFGPVRQARLKLWRDDPSKLNAEQLMAMIADIGKGRLAGRLAAAAVGLPPPLYIRAAIAHVASHV